MGITSVIAEQISQIQVYLIHYHILWYIYVAHCFSPTLLYHRPIRNCNKSQLCTEP